MPAGKPSYIFKWAVGELRPSSGNSLQATYWSPSRAIVSRRLSELRGMRARTRTEAGARDTRGLMVAVIASDAGDASVAIANARPRTQAAAGNTNVLNSI